MATTHLLTPPGLHHPSPSPAARLRATASLAHVHALLPSRPRPGPRLAALHSRAPSPRHRRRGRAMSVVRSSLIDPDGGALVELVAPPDRLPVLRAEAGALPRVRLAPVDLQWAHVLAEGWASPLRGFMREAEYLQSLHFNCIRLPDGGLVNMSLPIVLAVGDADKERIGDKPDVALEGPDGGVVAILRRSVLLLRFLYSSLPKHDDVFLHLFRAAILGTWFDQSQLIITCLQYVSNRDVRYNFVVFFVWTIYSQSN